MCIYKILMIVLKLKNHLVQGEINTNFNIYLIEFCLDCFW